MYLELSVLTLNIWGIPFVSKDRQLRVEAIGDFLSEGNFDVVSLQEVWSEHDYQFLKKRTENSLPYTHYFYSGVVGSGLCILSKYPIVTTLFHAWSVNGYVHRIQHGDWFGGKGVGLCKLSVHGHSVNVYIAHLHAEYDRDSDDYMAHRVIQAFDTAQFIETTGGGSVLQVLAGDLNTEPGDLAYRALLASSKLQETCNPLMTETGTNECKRNTYTSAESKKLLPNGKRIDYILYRGRSKYETKVLEYKLPLPEFIPGHELSYSDHEAIFTKILITEPEGGAPEGTCRKSDNPHRNDCQKILQECINICDESLNRLKSDKRFYLLMALTVFVVLLYTFDIYPPYGWRTMYLVLKVLLSGLTLFFAFMATLWNSIEHNGIYSGKLAMEMALQSFALEEDAGVQSFSKQCF